MYMRIVKASEPQCSTTEDPFIKVAASSIEANANIKFPGPYRRNLELEKLHTL
jgi:hypothetical protein